MRHVLRIVVLCRVLDAVVLQVLQPHFSDDSPMLRTLGEGAPCVSSELVECLALKRFGHGCGLPDNQQRQFGRKGYLLRLGQVVAVDNGHGSILGVVATGCAR